MIYIFISGAHLACKVVRKIQRENEAATISKLMQKKATKEQVIQGTILPPFSSLTRWRSSKGVKKCGGRLKRRKFDLRTLKLQSSAKARSSGRSR